MMDNKIYKTEDDTDFMIKSYYKRLKMSDEYWKWVRNHIQYNGDITLVRSEDAGNLLPLGKDYKLGQVIGSASALLNKAY